MKIRVSFALDVNPDAWAREYGVAIEDVREDVRTYVENGARDHLRDLGLLTPDQDRSRS